MSAVDHPEEAFAPVKPRAAEGSSHPTKEERDAASHPTKPGEIMLPEASSNRGSRGSASLQKPRGFHSLSSRGGAGGGSLGSCKRCKLTRWRGQPRPCPPAPRR